MSEYVLLGQGHDITQVPRQVWNDHLAGAPEHNKKRLAFMTEEHHRVRYFVVREIPRVGKPLSPAFIAEGTGLPLDQVSAILDELEENLFFLVRNTQGAVSWAFPITADETPHRLVFSTGEQTYAA